MFNFNTIGGTLINDEEKQSGLIGWNIYWYYFKKGKAALFAIVTICFVISVGSRVTGTWWLTEWTTHGAQSGVVTTVQVCKSKMSTNDRCQSVKPN